MSPWVRAEERPQRPVCPDRRCKRVMVPVGDAAWECPHMHGRRRVVERSIPQHPDIPRERDCGRCGDKHTLPGPCGSD